MSGVVNLDEARFDELKVHFGSDDKADQLTLEEFAALSEKRAEGLIDRIANTKLAGEISKIRAKAKQAFQTYQSAGKY